MMRMYGKCVTLQRNVCVCEYVCVCVCACKDSCVLVGIRVCMYVCMFPMYVSMYVCICMAEIELSRPHAYMYRLTH
jgi:hypothetical protein